MSTNAYDAQGTRLMMGGTTSPGPTAPFTEVKSIKPPNGKRSWKQRTDLDSAAHEGKPGLIDWGEFSVTCFWRPSDTVQAQAKNAFQQNTRQGFRLDFTNNIGAGTHWEWNGYIIGYGLPTVDVDGDHVIEISFRVDGALVATG